METNHNEVADVLDGAADVIERDGWTQGELVGADNTVCVMGALGRTTDLLDGRGWCDGWDGKFVPIVAARSALEQSLRLPTEPHEAVVVRWNDAPERTKQEVLDALRASAKDQRRLADGIDL